VLEPFVVNTRAARMERRSAESQGLRRVTQADMPLSYLPYTDAQREQHPVTEPAPPVVTDEMDELQMDELHATSASSTRGRHRTRR
jgi:hypothetical protein